MGEDISSGGAAIALENLAILERPWLVAMLSGDGKQPALL